MRRVYIAFTGGSSPFLSTKFRIRYLRLYVARLEFFKFRPQNVSVCEWQFGHSNLRLTGRLLSELPSMWSTCRVIGAFIQSDVPHFSHDAPRCFMRYRRRVGVLDTVPSPTSGSLTNLNWWACWHLLLQNFPVLCDGWYVILAPHSIQFDFISISIRPFENW